MSRAPDLLVENHGSLFLVRPTGKAGKLWLLASSPGDAQFFGGGMAVEPRYVLDVVAAARAAGLEVA